MHCKHCGETCGEREYCNDLCYEAHEVEMERIQAEINAEIDAMQGEPIPFPDPPNNPEEVPW